MPADRTTWQTPPELVDRLVEAYGPLALDPCTAADNPLGAGVFYTAQIDGLNRRWPPFEGRSLIFVNWPYSRQTNFLWAKKVNWEGSRRRLHTTVAALVPVSTSAKWWRRLQPEEYHFLPKRVAHIDPDTGERVRGSNFDSAVLVWTSDLARNPFGLGRVLV